MSGGYFCVRAAVERAGEAMRILHTQNNTLSRDSIIICPTTP